MSPFLLILIKIGFIINLVLLTFSMLMTFGYGIEIANGGTHFKKVYLLVARLSILLIFAANICARLLAESRGGLRATDWILYVHITCGAICLFFLILSAFVPWVRKYRFPSQIEILTYFPMAISALPIIWRL